MSERVKAQAQKKKKKKKKKPLRKNFLYFHKKNVFLYFRKWNFLKKPYIFSKTFFSYFQEGTCKTRKTSLLYFKKWNFLAPNLKNF